ncbi:hypothetical protein [Ruegeria jejuensis]|uniref:hypothetical protein n=1 Tax=Ruegeria jejuensis TaxID=3233338 RepID=UPI00355B9301
MSISRRELVAAGAAYLCGFPALARAADMSIESMLGAVREQLLDHSSDNPVIDAHNRMSSAELQNDVAHKSAYGTTNKGKVYVLAFEPEGRGLLRIENEPLEIGKWWISEADTIHSQWPSAANGDALDMYYRRLDDGLFFARTTDDRRHSFFFIGETPPELRSS